MKRSDLARFDQELLNAIRDGKTPAEQYELAEHFVRGLPFGYILCKEAQRHATQARQRLRKRGLVEMPEQRQPRLFGDLTEWDAEIIDDRRLQHIAAELKTRIIFNHRTKREGAAMEAAEMLCVIVQRTEPDAEPAGIYARVIAELEG